MLRKTFGFMLMLGLAAVALLTFPSAPTAPFPPGPTHLAALPSTPAQPFVLGQQVNLLFVPALMRPDDTWARQPSARIIDTLMIQATFKRPWSQNGQPGNPDDTIDRTILREGDGGQRLAALEGWGGVLPSPLLLAESHGGQRLSGVDGVTLKGDQQLAAYPVGWAPPAQLVGGLPIDTRIGPCTTLST